MENQQLNLAMQQATRVVKAGNPDRKNIYRIYLANEDGQAIVYATDSYHAIRVTTGREVPEDMTFKFKGLTIDPKSKIRPDYSDLLNHGNTGHAPPSTISSLFAPGRQMADIYHSTVPRLPDMRADTFGYYDGERRRPKALVDLTFSTKGCDPDKIDVLYRNGLKVEPHDEMDHANTGIYWQVGEPERRVLGSLDVIPPERKRLDASDGALFAARYLWPLAGASGIGYINPLKALYIAHLGGKVEFVIMPIRRP